MWYEGQPEQAIRLAQSAKKWNIAGIACGIVLMVFSFLIIFAVAFGVQFAIRRAIVGALTSNSTATWYFFFFIQGT